MQFKRRVFSVAACALTLLGVATTASANIVGTGCVVSGNAGQIAPSSVAQFTSMCSSNISGGLYTFSAPDILALNLSNSPQNTGAALIAGLGGTLLTGTAAAAFSPATSGSAGGGGNSTLWWLHETNIVPGTYTVTLTHDDGIVLVNGSTIVINSPNPTNAITNSATFTVLAGGTIDLFYDQCCNFPAVLTGTMPPEITAVVPEPASILLLGAVIVGSVTTIRRKRSSLS